jgi:hypothetical protein
VPCATPRPRKRTETQGCACEGGALLLIGELAPAATQQRRAAFCMPGATAAAGHCALPRCARSTEHRRHRRPTDRRCSTDPQQSLRSAHTPPAQPRRLTRCTCGRDAAPWQLHPRRSILMVSGDQPPPAAAGIQPAARIRKRAAQRSITSAAVFSCSATRVSGADSGGLRSLLICSLARATTPAAAVKARVEAHPGIYRAQWRRPPRSESTRASSWHHNDNTTTSRRAPQEECGLIAGAALRPARIAPRGAACVKPTGRRAASGRAVT